MDKIKIAYDFNGFLKWGYDNPVPLSKTDYIIDSNGNTIMLSEGIEIRIYETDYDVFDRQDDLYADGAVIRNPDSNNDFKWWFQINNLGIKHESDDLTFLLPELSTDEKRNIIYKSMEREIASIRDWNWWEKVGKGQLEYYMRILRKIDSGEL
ncbi:MAG: hypothetical protein FWD80_01590 [Propionibacteriaceae bacterium]|nr:hypothetical protein [Propionibacteriaceae bacterium]